jgi:hypothetical protein
MVSLRPAQAKTVSQKQNPNQKTEAWLKWESGGSVNAALKLLGQDNLQESIAGHPLHIFDKDCFVEAGDYKLGTVVVPHTDF